MRSIVGLPALALIAVVGHSSPARADWYGWQTLLADSGGTATILAASELEPHEKLSEVLYIAGLTAVLAGPPVIHILHEDYWQSAVSALGRPALVLGGGALAGMLFPCKHDDADPWKCFIFGDSVVYGGIIGYAAAAILDAALLSKGEAEMSFSIGGSF